MASVADWNKYMNLLHELALVEDDLREGTRRNGEQAHMLAARILFERFGVSA